MTLAKALLQCPPKGNAGVALYDNKEVPVLKGAFYWLPWDSSRME